MPGLFGGTGGGSSSGLFGPQGGTPGAGNFSGLVTQTGGSGGITPGSVPTFTGGPGGLGVGFGQPAIPAGGGPGEGFGFTPPAPLGAPSGFSATGTDPGLFGIGGSQGQNFTVEQTQQQSQISPVQAGGLGQNIQAALQLAANQLDPNSQLSQFLAGPGAALFGTGQNFLSGLLESQQGLNALEDPSIVQGRIDALGQDIRTQLGEAVGGAGGLLSRQALAGNLGGGRSQVARGIAGRGAVDAFARGAAQIRESAAGRRLTGLLGGAQAGALGTAAAGDVFNLGLGPSAAAFSPLLSLAQIIGDPQVTQQSLQQLLSQGVQSGEGAGATLGGVGNLLTGINQISPLVGKLFDQIFDT